MNDQSGKWGKKPTASTATPQMKEAVKKGKIKRFTFNIDEELHHRFKVYATKKNITMHEILITYIQQILDKD